MKDEAACGLAVREPRGPLYHKGTRAWTAGAIVSRSHPAVQAIEEFARKGAPGNLPDLDVLPDVTDFRVLVGGGIGACFAKRGKKAAVAGRSAAPQSWPDQGPV